MKTASHKSKELKIILVTLVFLGIAITSIYFFREQLHISAIIPSRETVTKPLKGTIRCTLITTVGDHHYLRMKLAIPYENRAQWKELKKMVPALKHEFISSMDDTSMQRIIMERDFEALRGLLVRIINRHVEEQVPTVYFEAFFYD